MLLMNGNVCSPTITPSDPFFFFIFFPLYPSFHRSFLICISCVKCVHVTQPGQLTPTYQRNVPYRMTSCSAYKTGGKQKEGEDIQSDGICLPK